MNGLYFIPIFSVVVIGMLTRKVPAFAANLSLIAGVAVIAYGYFFSDWIRADANPNGIHEFHFLGIVFASLLILMAFFGLVAPRKVSVDDEAIKADTTAHQAHNMQPWPLAVPAGVLLFLTVLGIYLYFLPWKQILDFAS